MSDRGIIGAAPEQKRHSSKGVFSLAEINEFQNINEYENDKIIASYTLVGGGGGGGGGLHIHGVPYWSGGGGGGAGVLQVSNQAKFTIGTNYAVTVGGGGGGGGGSGNNNGFTNAQGNGAAGGNTTLVTDDGTETAYGSAGGAGAAEATGHNSANASGGGGGGYNSTQSGGTSGSQGNNGSSSSGSTGGNGGTFASVGNNSNFYQGWIVTAFSHFATKDELVSTHISASGNGNYNPFLSSNSGGAAGPVNTGNGGGCGRGGGSGAAGGSGVIAIQYPAELTISLGTNVGTTRTSKDGKFKVTTITAGGDNISWSKA